jgi:hypothetical protein
VWTKRHGPRAHNRVAYVPLFNAGYFGSLKELELRLCALGLGTSVLGGEEKESPQNDQRETKVQ